MQSLICFEFRDVCAGWLGYVSCRREAICFVTFYFARDVVCRLPLGMSSCFPFPFLAFCPRTDVTLVAIELAKIVVPLFKVCIGPDPPPSLPNPKDSRVSVAQVERSLSVQWNACLADKSPVSNVL